jgi:hypothetical protein
MAGSIPAVLGILHILMKPRLPIVLGVGSCYAAAAVVVTAIFTDTAAVDHVVVCGVLAAATAVFTIDSYVRERAERKSFLQHATLIKATLEIERLSEGTRTVVGAALPKELIALELSAPTNHRSDDASIAVCDIADFANWSCGLLIKDVVESLHELMLLVDVSATLNDVVNVMSYGDSCAACAGLVSSCDNHLERVSSFGTCVLESSTAHQFRVRVSVCSGELIGGIAGDACKRYIVAGRAFTAAKAALPGVAPSAMSVAAALPAAAAATNHVSVVPVASDAVVAADTLSLGSAQSATLRFSWWWLSFGDGDTQDQFLAFESRHFRASKHLMAAIPVILFTTVLFAMVADFFGGQGRYTRSPELAMVGLAVCVLLASLVAALRRAWLAFPFGLDAALYAVAIAVCTAALGPPGETYGAVTALTLIVLIGLPDLFPRLPWLAQWVLITVCISGVVIALGERQRVDVLFSTSVFVGVVRYYIKRLACLHFVAEASAALAADAAREQTGRYDELLAGLLPPHAVKAAGHVTAAAIEDGGHVFSRQWAGMSVLQLQLSVAGVRDMSVFAAAWRSVATSVAAVPGALLQLLETSGDGFLIAGPFDMDATDELRVDSARGVLRLLAALSEVTAPFCPFTAAATAGSAYSALMGYSGLSFRFFGPAVRESNAILAAAPVATAVPLAFASAGFRQQHDNFGVAARSPRRGRRASSFAMSLATLSESTHDTHAAVSAESAAFGAATNWRIRGVGVARVSTIKQKQTSELARD